MRDCIAREKALVMKLEQTNVSITKKEINRRILNDLPSDFDVEEKMFLLMTDTDPDKLGVALARVEDSRTSNEGAGGTHALVTGVKTRGGGQGRGGGARRNHGGRGNARGRRVGKGHQPHHHQQQWASQTLVQYQQEWASQSPAQQQQPQKHQRQPQQHQRQPQQQQRQPQRQQQRPPGHLAGWGPSRVCFRCGQPGHLSSFISRAAKRMSPSTIDYPAGRSTGQLLCDFSWRLRVFFGTTRTPNAHAAGPARNAGTFRLVLELHDRLGFDDPVLSPRRVCVFEWSYVQ